MKKTTNFKQAEKWALDHHMNAKQTATMMGNIEDESTGITSMHGDKNYMQYEHGNGLHGKNMYDYIGKFEARMPKMGEFVREFKHASLGKDESFFHNSVEVGKYGERRAELTHEMLPQVEKDFKKINHQKAEKKIHRREMRAERKAKLTAEKAEAKAAQRSENVATTTNSDQATTTNQPTQQLVNSNGRSEQATLNKYQGDLGTLAQTVENVLGMNQNQNQTQTENQNELG